MHYSAVGFLLPITISIATAENQLIKVFCRGKEMAKISCIRSDGDHSQLLDNNEYKIVGDCRPLSDMRSIDFFGCGFEYLPGKFLEKFVAAEEIDIVFRQLQVISSEDFRGNVNLKSLIARVNELTELPPHLFKYTPKIEKIDFTQNKIARIDPNTFDVGVDNLKTLNLTGNQIKTLDGRTFLNAVSLENLNLHYNPIDEIRIKIIQQDQIDRINVTLENNSTNHIMIFPFAAKKTLSVCLSFNKLNEFEVDCGSGMRCFLRQSGSLHSRYITIFGEY